MGALREETHFEQRCAENNFFAVVGIQKRSALLKIMWTIEKCFPFCVSHVVSSASYKREAEQNKNKNKIKLVNFQCFSGWKKSCPRAKKKKLIFTSLKQVFLLYTFSISAFPTFPDVSGVLDVVKKKRRKRGESKLTRPKKSVRSPNG